MDSPDIGPTTFEKIGEKSVDIHPQPPSQEEVKENLELIEEEGKRYFKDLKTGYKIPIEDGTAGQSNKDSVITSRIKTEIINPEQPFFKELTPEEQKAVQEAEQTGFYNGFRVLDKGHYGNRRLFVLEDPKTGQHFQVVPGLKEVVNMYYAPDPEPAHKASEAAFGQWVEKHIRVLEKTNKSGLINENIIASWEATIQGVEAPVISPVFLKEQFDKVKGRLHYHNTSKKAEFLLADFASEFSTIQNEEHLAILDTPGVERVLEEFDNNNGLYFRLDSDHPNPALRPNAEEARIKGILAATGLNPEQVELAFELALKSSHIFGESAWFNGIVDAAGNLVEPPAGSNYEQTMDFYANYIVDNWDAIIAMGGVGGANLLKGQGAGNMRDAFFYPLVLQKYKKGTVEEMRKYIYLWVNSAVKYRMEGPTSPQNIRELMRNIKDYRIKLLGWAKSLSEAQKNREVFYLKGDASILNRPLIEPNLARREENIPKAVPGSLDNYKKNVEEALGHVISHEGSGHIDSITLAKDAKAHILKGVLRYVNSEDGRRRFTYLGWNQNIIAEALEWAVKEGLITREMKDGRLSRELGLSALNIGWHAGSSELGRTLSDAWGKFLGGIFRK